MRGAVMGDGSLDPARLRERYRVDAGPWLRMVGDLLAQVVGDSGSLEQASVVLAVPLRSLAAWCGGWRRGGRVRRRGRLGRWRLNLGSRARPTMILWTRWSGGRWWGTGSRWRGRSCGSPTWCGSATGMRWCGTCCCRSWPTRGQPGERRGRSACPGRRSASGSDGWLGNSPTRGERENVVSSRSPWAQRCGCGLSGQRMSDRAHGAVSMCNIARIHRCPQPENLGLANQALSEVTSP